MNTLKKASRFFKELKIYESLVKSWSDEKILNEFFQYQDKVEEQFPSGTKIDFFAFDGSPNVRKLNILSDEIERRKIKNGDVELWKKKSTPGRPPDFDRDDTLKWYDELKVHPDFQHDKGVRKGEPYIKKIRDEIIERHKIKTGFPPSTEIIKSHLRNREK